LKWSFSRRWAENPILKFYLYTGARIATGCKLTVSDFHQDGDEATLRFHIKGGRHKTEGIHFSAAESIAEYIKAAGTRAVPSSAFAFRSIMKRWLRAG
jgi:hypothetical protein